MVEIMAKLSEEAPNGICMLNAMHEFNLYHTVQKTLKLYDVVLNFNFGSHNTVLLEDTPNLVVYHHKLYEIKLSNA